MSDDYLKIMGISLVSSKKHKAYAVFNGEQLVVTNVTPIASGLLSVWKNPLIEEIIQKKADGFAVLVEEKTDLIAQYGTQYLLEDIEGKSNLYDALDWYFALQDMGNLIMPSELGAYQIRSGHEGQRIEKKQDEKGRPVYDVDWTTFHGGYRAVLLCVVAAMAEPLSERFLEAMWGKAAPEPEDENPVRRWVKLIAERDLAKGIVLEGAREKLAREMGNKNV